MQASCMTQNWFPHWFCMDSFGCIHVIISQEAFLYFPHPYGFGAAVGAGAGAGAGAGHTIIDRPC